MRLNKKMIGKRITFNNGSTREFHRHSGVLESYGGGYSYIRAGKYGEVWKFENREWEIEKIED